MVTTIGDKDSNVHKNCDFLFDGHVQFLEIVHEYDMSGVSYYANHNECMLMVEYAC